MVSGLGQKPAVSIPPSPPAASHDWCPAVSSAPLLPASLPASLPLWPVRFGRMGLDSKIRGCRVRTRW